MRMFGKRLKELREKQGLTQKQLGEALHLTKTSISCYENETRTPSVDTLLDILDFFQVDFNVLIGNDHYVVEENGELSPAMVSKEEVVLLKELRRHPILYHQLLNKTKDTVSYLEKKIN